MPVYDKLHDGIYCVDAAHLREQLAAIYVLREDEEVAIIDTGTCHSLENVQSTLGHLGIDNSQGLSIWWRSLQDG